MSFAINFSVSLSLSFFAYQINRLTTAPVNKVQAKNHTHLITRMFTYDTGKIDVYFPIYRQLLKKKFKTHSSLSLKHTNHLHQIAQSLNMTLKKRKFKLSVKLPAEKLRRNFTIFNVSLPNCFPRQIKSYFLHSKQMFFFFFRK